uniref:Uncharacterized protein n=1 Tax=Megaselia scalaris TaxID=36166 RepID=T1GNH7_MEGSC
MDHVHSAPTRQQQFLFHSNSPLRNALKNYKQIIENDTGLREHFIQGDLWKRKLTFFQKDDIVLPFFWFADGYGINNPLGTKSASIESTYFVFPTLNRSQALQNILSAAFIKSKDLKRFGTERCLIHLVKEFNRLSCEGIDFNINDSKVNVKFQLGLLLGDNMGINTYFNLNSHSSNYFCRFCKLSSRETQCSIREDPNSLRTIENYLIEAEDKNSSTSAVKDNSVCNQIQNFHVTENMHVDEMHDWLEGYFDLQMLNNRINTFSYGSREIGNRSTHEITSNHLNSKKLKMTARQMWCFNLAELIARLNSNFISLFQDNLKPKFHYLTHYPRIIKESGPPRFYSSLRFESKHVFNKEYCNSITSRKNILLSLCIKSQLNFAYYLKFTPKLKKISWKKNHKIKSNYKILDEQSLQSLKIVNFNGTEYKISNYIPGAQKNNNQFLFEIKEIVISSEENVYIIANKIGKLVLDSQYNCHQVLETPTETVFMNINNFSLPIDTHKVNCSTYIFHLKPMEKLNFNIQKKWIQPLYTL